MTSKKFIVIIKTSIYLIIAIVVITAIAGIKGCVEECSREDARKEARKEAYEARFPKLGDKIELNGKEVVIIKLYFFGPRKYQVRLSDGRMTDVVGSELIDKKPIVAEK